uniref:Uncharacterized protein n=1 Tax=Siphoviridae sp. ctGfF74 TaxID=2826223 RepID=A0A8S5NJN5_9CAUD|nr:MAG TPA: hypothetical protein [Siphoviridae sp. ctGfF74]
MHSYTSIPFSNLHSFIFSSSLCVVFFNCLYYTSMHLICQGVFA